MTSTNPQLPILELRIALTTRDFDRLLWFYTEGLGLTVAADWSGELGRGLMFAMGAGSLELFDDQYAGHVDAVEVGQRVSGPVRFALRVPNLDAALARLRAQGATIVHDPISTPWGDRNARVQAPDGMQVTLYEAAE